MAEVIQAAATLLGIVHRYRDRFTDEQVSRIVQLVDDLIATAKGSK